MRHVLVFILFVPDLMETRRAALPDSCSFIGVMLEWKRSSEKQNPVFRRPLLAITLVFNLRPSEFERY